jgi:hypothetical protein
MFFGLSSLKFLFLSAILSVISSGSLTWDNPQVNAIAGLGDKEAVALFTFKNTGLNPVTVHDIDTTCECTVAELPKRVYAPGEGGAVRVVFTIGDRTGPQDRVISVTTDDPNNRTARLHLRLDIPAPLTWSARMVQWSIGGAADVKYLEVTAGGGGRIAAVEIKNAASPQVTVESKSMDGGAKYGLALKPVRLDQSGTFAISGIVRLEGGAEHPFTVYALIR